MSIVSYIKSLLPKFGKDRVFEDSRIIKTEIDTVGIPSFKEAEKVFNGWKFESEEMKDMIKVFSRNVKSSGSDNIITTIRKALETLSENQEIIDKKLEETLEDDIIVDGITCLKANLIRVIEGIGFLSKYSISLLNYIYVVETANRTSLEGGGNYVTSNFSPAELDYINKNFLQFCTVLAVLTKSKPELTKILEQIPDILIGGHNADAVASSMSNDKLDPLAMHGFTDISSNTKNPIYHIALMVAEWQANRYKLSKETKKILELRLLNLQLLVQKNPDAKLEKEIEYIQSRIQGLDHKIQQMEASVK